MVDHWLLKRIRTFAESSFLANSNGVYRYDELCDRVDALGCFFENSEIEEGSSVALVGDFTFESVALFLALFLRRCIIAPIIGETNESFDDRLEEGQIEYLLYPDKKGPKIEATRFVGEQNPLFAKVRSDGCAGLILYSSGTSGKPKAMLHDLNALVNSYSSRRVRKLAFMVLLMFDHIGGLNTLLNCIACGSLLVVPADSTPDSVCRMVEAHRVNILPASPTFLNLLLMSEKYNQYDLRSLKIITYGTEPMPESLLARLKSSFAKTKLLQTFGTSETGITTSVSLSSNSTFFKIDDPNTEYKIVEGELWLKSSTQILGYLNHTMERFTQEGWFKTGDQVEEIENGYLRIVGRFNEIINVGGLKVQPVEVESVVGMLDEVMDCRAYGEPNAITGQIVVCEVVAAEETEKKRLRKAIRIHCRAHLESYKNPVKILFVETPMFSQRLKKIRIQS